MFKIITNIFTMLLASSLYVQASEFDYNTPSEIKGTYTLSNRQIDEIKRRSKTENSIAPWSGNYYTKSKIVAGLKLPNILTPSVMEDGYNKRANWVLYRDSGRNLDTGVSERYNGWSKFKRNNQKAKYRMQKTVIGYTRDSYFNTGLLLIGTGDGINRGTALGRSVGNFSNVNNGKWTSISDQKIYNHTNNTVYSYIYYHTREISRRHIYYTYIDLNSALQVINDPYNTEIMGDLSIKNNINSKSATISIEVDPTQPGTLGIISLN